MLKEEVQMEKPKVIRVNDYLKTDTGFAHDVIRIEAKKVKNKSKTSSVNK